jgi:L-ascorbate metabolism protein UlaG (beta-lactamase superfamily)
MCVSRRQVLIGSAAVAVAGAGLPGVPAFASGRSGVSLRWPGVAGWELLFDGRRVLIDPYPSRLPVFDEEGKFIADYPLASAVRKELVDEHLGARPELVLATHGHYDHLLEIPYVVEKHGSRVIGTETHRHLLTAQGVPPDNVVVASGGEHLDFHGFTVQVFRSLHSQFGAYGYFAPGTLTAPPSGPATISDLVEGGSLAYMVTVRDFSVLFMSGTANYVEREIAGLRPS